MAAYPASSLAAHFAALPYSSPSAAAGGGQSPSFPASALPGAEQPSARAVSRQLHDQHHQHGLPAILGMRDLTVLMVLIVLFVPNTNGVQFAGPASFLYWLLGLLTFLLPCAIVTRWLARRYPGQGAPYLWAARVLGPRWSFFAAFCAWLPGVLAVVSVIESGIVFLQYLAPSWFVTPAQQSPIIVLALLLATAFACLPLRWLKHLLLLMTSLYLAVFVLLGIAGVCWLAAGHPAAVAYARPASWQPSGNTFAIYGIVVLALLGVDIPIFLGGEIRGGRTGARRASNYVWWGSACAIVAYLLGTFGIMTIVPTAQAGSTIANVQAIATVFGPLAGTIVDIVLACSQVAIVVAYILLFSRLLLVVAQGRRLPVALTIINRHGVPVVSILAQAALVAVATILSYVAVPLVFESVVNPADLAVEIYNVTQAGTTVVWICSTIQVFLLVLIQTMRKRIRKTGKASSRYASLSIAHVRRFAFIAVSVVGIGASLVGGWATISSSWLPTLVPNGRWCVLVLTVTVISLLIGWAVSEVPRMHSLLGEQRRLNSREVALRQALQASYDEQEMLLLQHKEVLIELDSLYREQAQAAETDAVSGLPNHRSIMNRIDEELARCHRLFSVDANLVGADLARSSLPSLSPGQPPEQSAPMYRPDPVSDELPCAILFVDLDHFKHINDTWGHRAGDAILHQIGHRLHAALRLEDFVGRYGGEEFAVILTNVDLSLAVQIAERMRIAIAAEPCQWQPEEKRAGVAGRAELASALAGTPTSEEATALPQTVSIAVTGSIGVALYGMHGRTREALIEAADRAMYHAKHSGRNRVSLADVANDDAEQSTASTQQVAERGDAHDGSGYFVGRDPNDGAGEQDSLPEESEATASSIRALTAAANVHDRGTDEHAQRMVALAEATALRLGLSSEEMNLVRLGALLHDIGKIGIPDAILHKPGPLTEEEWHVMRRHPEIGRQILEQTDGGFGCFVQLAQVVAAHHERWDGTGYPVGLAGEAIPLGARILSVVDSYDAMISRRVYHEPLSHVLACAELRRCAGSQFDPHVVEAFLAILDEHDHLLLSTSPTSPERPQGSPVS